MAKLNCLYTFSNLFRIFRCFPLVFVSLVVIWRFINIPPAESVSAYVSMKGFAVFSPIAENEGPFLAGVYPQAGLQILNYLIRATYIRNEFKDDRIAGIVLFLMLYFFTKTI